jgi:hypothetical protein
MGAIRTIHPASQHRNLKRFPCLLNATVYSTTKFLCVSESLLHLFHYCAILLNPSRSLWRCQRVSVH